MHYNKITMSDITFETLKKMHHWKPIPNCPGRFILAGGVSAISPEALSGKPATIHGTTPLPDPVYVIPIPGGGIISYRKSANTFIHTLCTPEGFSRKLKSIGIQLP